MQSDPIPASVLNSKRDKPVTGSQKLISQSGELIRLTFRELQLYANGSLHRAKKYVNRLFYLQNPTEEQRFLPALKDWVSVLSTG